jgi:copper chaperone NosL
VKTIALLPAIIVVLLSACGNSAQWPPAPAVTHLGEDSCSACKMIISQEKYGAQLHQQGKKLEVFDDYGCLLTRTSSGESAERVIYVRSAEDGSWIHESQAFYVVSKQISTPMGYGIAAFATKESASAFSSGLNDSRTYSQSELIPAVQSILNAR